MKRKRGNEPTTTRFRAWDTLPPRETWSRKKEASMSPKSRKLRKEKARVEKRGKKVQSPVSQRQAEEVEPVAQTPGH